MACFARLGALITIGVIGFQAIAFVPFKNTSGTEVSWNTLPIDYAINQTGTTDVSGSAEFDAVRAAFAMWNAIVNSDLEFTEAASLTLADPATDPDGVSVVGWIEDASNELVAAVDLRAGTICFGPTNVDCTESTGTEISEADIFFNGVHYTWTNEGNGNFSSSRGPLDIQAILTHEIGHMAGIEHVVTEGNTLFPFTFEGSIEWRTLSQDETSFAQATYPSAGAPAESSISGRVTRSGSTAVPGAYVIAIQGNGNVVGAIADSNGDYAIRRVPAPGDYFVRVVPHTTAPGIMDGSSYYRSTTNVDVSFLAEFYHNSAEIDQATPTNPPGAQTVAVTVGNTMSGIDLEVSAIGSVEDTLEPDDPAVSARGPINTSGAQELHHSCTETVPNACDTIVANLDEDWVEFQAQQNAIYVIETLNVGIAVATGDQEGRTFLQLFSTTDTVNPLTLCPQFSGSVCQNSSRNVLEEDPRSLLAYEETAAGTTTRLIKSRQADADKVGAGAYFDLSITKLFGPYSQPTVTSVDPASGIDDGGYVVTVRGSNFIPGARVTFGGTAATDEDVQDCDVALTNC